jgi:aspartate aminotransferase
MISERAKQIQPSATLSIAARAGEMKRNGIAVISLSAGEPDYDTPEEIKKKAIRAILEGFTKYTPTSGIPKLKQAVCEKLKRDNSLSYSPEQILISNGAKHSLYNLLLTLVNPGDEVLIPVPYWVSYVEMVKLAEGKSIFLPCNKAFKIDGKTIEKYATNKTKALILCSPSNPTGAIYTRKELEEIAAVCLKKRIFVISDEIYEKLIYDREHFSIAQVSEGMKRMTAVVNGVSKAYAMTGWRIGYAAADEALIKAATRIQDHTTSNPNSIAQMAALAALHGDQTCVSEMRMEYKKRRDYIVERLKKIKGIQVQRPDGAFYVFPNISSVYGKKIKNSREFCEKLLEEMHVAVVPGRAFGEDTCIRLSYAASMEEIKEGVDRIELFMKRI